MENASRYLREASTAYTQQVHAPPRRGQKESAIPTKIFVGNLSFSTTREELTNLLSEVGRVLDVHLPSDRETGRPRGFAFVEFSSETEVAEAIKRFHNREVGGRRLNVNAAEDRPRRTDGARPPRFRPQGAVADPGFAPDPFELSSGRSAKPFKNKGSRRGMRARKRSLNY
jgi:RNA recognition motif-containing protein